MISDAILGGKRAVPEGARHATKQPQVKAPKVWESYNDTELRLLLDSQRNIASRIDLMEAAKRANISPEVQDVIDSKQFAKDNAFLDQIKVLAKSKKLTFKETVEEGTKVYRVTGKLQTGKRFDLSMEFRSRSAVRFLADVFVSNGGRPTLAVEELSVEIKTFAQYANLLARIERESAAAAK